MSASTGFILLSAGAIYGYIMCRLLVRNNSREQNNYKCCCKDCKHTDGHINHCGDVWCETHQCWFEADGFCSYGIRRDV